MGKVKIKEEGNETKEEDKTFMEKVKISVPFILLKIFIIIFIICSVGLAVLSGIYFS